MSASTPALIKSLLLACTLGLAVFAAPAHAYVWENEYGQVMSNTCIGDDGAFMDFAYEAGPVGAPCQFYFNGMPGVHFGRFG